VEHNKGGQAKAYANAKRSSRAGSKGRKVTQIISYNRITKTRSERNQAMLGHIV